MATFITTVKFTEQGIQNIKDTTKRAAALKSAAKRIGIEVAEFSGPSALPMACSFSTPGTTKRPRP